MPAELRVKVLNVVTRTGTAKRWLAQWLLLMRHNPPNADSVKAQISKISPDVLFAQYALFAEQAREVPLLQKGFAGLFSMVRSLDLVMRTSKQGSSECWYCGLLKQFLKDGAGFAGRKWSRIFILSTPVGTMEKPRSTRMFAFWPRSWIWSHLHEH